MSDPEFPVFVSVVRTDGGVDRVRVGSAVKSDDGFLLRIGELHIGSTPIARASVSAPPPGDGSGPVFPNYGRSKNQPIAGATETDLEYYANGCRRTLGDETKARWHDKERVLLAAIEAEVARQRGGVSSPSSHAFDDGPPPRGDDDIPF